MRKRLITAVPQVGPQTNTDWLDLGSLASVEVTSETRDHPVESALLLGDRRGWRAAQPGIQIIRLLFDHPLRVTLISLVFEDEHANAGVCSAMVFRFGPFLQRDCAAAMEFQPAGDSAGSGELLG